MILASEGSFHPVAPDGTVYGIVSNGGAFRTWKALAQHEATVGPLYAKVDWPGGGLEALLLDQGPADDREHQPGKSTKSVFTSVRASLSWLILSPATASSRPAGADSAQIPQHPSEHPPL